MGRPVFLTRASSRLPWNSPQSSSRRFFANSSRCIEPVTSPAAPWKVMRALTGAKDPVSGVAQARQDVAVLVELAVEGGGVDRDVGVRRQHLLHAGRRRDDAEEADRARARLLERGARVGGRP